MAPPRSVSSATTVAVVTVSYRSQDVLAEFLGSVRAASATPLTIVVADNLPGEGAEVARLSQEVGATYLAMTANLGYGSAMNAAARSLPAEIEWILVANPDVSLSPGAIDRLVATGREDPAIGSVGPAIHNSDGTLYPSARAVPSLRNGIGHAMFANLWTGNPWSKAYRKDSDNPPVCRDTGWLSGACVLLRRAAFDQLGGFDPGYFMYFEDVDLGYRLGKLGYRNVYEPAATVTHSGAHSTSTASARMIEAHHDSARRFLAKKYSGAPLWPVRTALTLGLTLRSSLVRRKLQH